jgi:cyanophycin synthetase
LAAFVQGVPVASLQSALQSFGTSAAQTPGRMNLFNMGRYHALVDYAHNPAGYEAIGGFVKNWPGTAIGVVGGPGDRRDEDLLELGALAAQIFDQIVVKEDDDRRGRAPGEVANLIVQGIQQAIDDTGVTVAYQVELNETAAIEQVLDSAPEQGLVVILPESVRRAIGLITARGPLPETLEAPVVNARSAKAPRKSVPSPKSLPEVAIDVVPGR